MSRAIDTCTCGRDRSEHGNATGHAFMPHPQPDKQDAPSFPIQVRNMLMNMGVVSSSAEGDKMFVTMPDGDYWEVQVVFRKGGIYSYPQVPAHQHRLLINAYSPGQTFDILFRDRTDFSRSEDVT